MAQQNIQEVQNGQASIFRSTINSNFDNVKIIYGSGAPTTSTEAAFIGQHYFDKNNKVEYVCINDTAGSRQWKKIPEEKQSASVVNNKLIL